MRIAITGGSGRVGRATTATALDGGHSVVSIDQVPPPADTPVDPRVTFIQADLTDYGAVQRALAGCDALIHLAAIPSPGRHPDHETHNNNVCSSYNALRAAAEVGIHRVCQASSVNATGLAYSRWPRFDYFPLDEQHPTYNEDPYSLSKWICEAQGDSLARRYEQMTIASLRFHWVVPERATTQTGSYNSSDSGAKNLWGYVRLDATARACVASLTATYMGHEAFYIVAPDTTMERPSLELAQHFFPEVPLRGDLRGTGSFFDCSKAERLFGWRHDQ
ncbi:MAG: NAD(P)-dependent oxidoreductase [Herpetosiphon sp.]